MQEQAPQCDHWQREAIPFLSARWCVALQGMALISRAAQRRRLHPCQEHTNCWAENILLCGYKTLTGKRKGCADKKWVQKCFVYNNPRCCDQTTVAPRKYRVTTTTKNTCTWKVSDGVWNGHCCADTLGTTRHIFSQQKLCKLLFHHLHLCITWKHKEAPQESDHPADKVHKLYTWKFKFHSLRTVLI